MEEDQRLEAGLGEGLLAGEEVLLEVLASCFDLEVVLALEGVVLAWEEAGLCLEEGHLGLAWGEVDHSCEVVGVLV